MINPPTDCFYTIQLMGEAAELVTSTVSPGSIADIKEAILISDDFTSDIEAINKLDVAMTKMRSGLVDQDLTELTSINPFYVPSTPAQLNSMLDGDIKSETYHFVGMDGNPFTLKTVIVISSEEEGVMAGRVLCKPFELPPFCDIIAEQANIKLN